VDDVKLRGLMVLEGKKFSLVNGLKPDHRASAPQRPLLERKREAVTPPVIRCPMAS
jgi:hypothetical protein